MGFFNLKKKNTKLLEINLIMFWKVGICGFMFRVTFGSI